MTAAIEANVRAPRDDAPNPPSKRAVFVGRSVTLLIVIGPIAALAVAVPFMWGHMISLRDIAIATAFYFITGFGVTVGYHRLFTHRSFRAKRGLKWVLAIAGSMAIEGSPTSWVANHRRHHMHSDREGDPHSPHLSGTGLKGQFKGLVHAHVGWLFVPDTTSARRYAPEMVDDPDSRIISRLFPLFALLSFAAPFFLGWTLSGAFSGALTALLWAGLARMALLHHVTWSVNSVCHMFGKQPATDKDHSTNFAPLAIISMGESWHNFHHAHPSSARHGALRWQIDPSAMVIRFFERVGLATHVRWPTETQLANIARR